MADISTKRAKELGALSLGLIDELEDVFKTEEGSLLSLEELTIVLQGSLLAVVFKHLIEKADARSSFVAAVLNQQ